MNIFRKFANQIKAWWLSVHESVEESPLRGRLGRWLSRGRVPDPNEVNDERSRRESIRLSQHLEVNDAFAIRLGRLWVQYTVGAGLPIKPASSDEEWNTLRKVSWDRWCEMPDLISVQDFDSFQVMAATRTFFDGAGYIYKTRGDVKPFRPRIQFIEAANIQTPPERYGLKNIFDGKETDYRGRIIAYHVRQMVNGEESFRRIDAKDIIPICDFNRPGELHCFPYLDPVLNQLRDLRELRKLAMDKAKEAAETKNVYNTENRELPDADQMRKNKFLGGTTTTLKDGTLIEADRIQMLDEKLGGKNIAIGINEKVSQLNAGTPNQIEQAHYRILAEEICAGVSIPVMLVFPESIQGTVSRAILDDFTTYCRNQSKIFQRALLEVYRYVTEEEMKFTPALADVPKNFDWWKASIRPPRAPNVDVGRNSAAMIAELEAGCRTYQSVYAPEGLDEYEQLEIRAREEAKIDELATKYKIDPTRIRASIADALKIQMQDQADRKQKEEDAVPA